MNKEFSPNELTNAIKSLFEMNNYEVEGPVKIHGAEIDLVARSLTERFSSPIYIEATIEYVSNEKYGKDTTKFILIQAKDPSSKCLIVSSRGFTIDVKERAIPSRIETLTYDELFQKFQNFGKYVEYITEKGDYAEELNQLSKVYEKAYFNDKIGKHVAVDFLNSWVQQSNPVNPWIVVVGDYGTGKTALTKYLQRHWVDNYKTNPNLPIPFRIELREFSKQFDERGLIHHFIDTNNLKIPIDFVFDLIRQGKVILLLDGYDEMAQYMHVRERRNCLTTLAKLSKDGARGILTSRPNYFTVTEELSILDAFYTQIEIEKRSLFGKRSIQSIIEKEKEYDSLLKRLVDRYERQIQDLDEIQTKNLVRNILDGDHEGQQIIIGILERVFKQTGSGDEVSLSGKPVIISYLIEVIDEIKRDEEGLRIPLGTLNEWQIFEYILLKLMLRDFRRADLIHPDDRRDFLRLLSIEISAFSNFKINEDGFRSLINNYFHNKFRVIQLHDEREKIKEQYFADLRSSATLTRSLNEDFWQFSHNSLREFLSTEYYYHKLLNNDIKIGKIVPISDVMKMFINSLPGGEIKILIEHLRNYYSNYVDKEIISFYMSLLWESALIEYKEYENPIGNFLSYLTNGRMDFSNIMIGRLNFFINGKTTKLSDLDIKSSILYDFEFKNCIIERSNFSESILSGIKFNDCHLLFSDFSNSVIEDVDFDNVLINNAIFNGAEIKLIKFNGKLYSGKEAQGILALNGAQIKNIEPIYVYKHHEGFPIAEKISSMLLTASNRQIRGLVQRGSAAKNTRAAQKFFDLLISEGFASIRPARRDLVGITDIGRKELINLVEMRSIPAALMRFFED